MKRQLIALIALVAIPAFSFAQTADEVIDKHIAALGGANKIAAIKTMEQEQTMSVQGMDIVAKAAYVVGKSVRSDVSVMGQQITNVVDGDKGWMINPMSGGTTPKDLTAEEMKIAKGTAEPNVFQLAYLKANKYPYELVGKEKQKDKDVYNVKVTRPEGTFNYFVDAATYRLTGFKGAVEMQGQKGETTGNYSDFKEVEGITLPFTSNITAPGMPGTITAKLTKVTFNQTVDPSIFNKPK